MPITESYLITTKNLSPIIESIVNAQAPEKFTIQFLTNLGYKSTNDRLYIRLFKDLGLLDSGGSPTQKYYEFIDKSRTKSILGHCIREAYSDLFQLNKEAYKMSKTDVKNKFKTIFQGSKKDNVFDLMAKTFVELCKLADFNDYQIQTVDEEDVQEEHIDPDTPNRQQIGEIINKNITTEMHYNIQIHLPESKDIAVYDAIFKSLKEHLL